LRTDGQAARVLNRFAVFVAAGSTAALMVIAFSPLAGWWQQQLAGLSEELTELAIPALRLGALIPALATAQSLLRGIVIKEGATGAIAQATIVNLGLLALVLLVGVVTGWMPGVFLAALALTAARLGESVLLWLRARSLPPLLEPVPVTGHG
jgi:O-antigen/teichoic acid export membrane protein